MCFAWISEQRAIISLYSFNLSVFKTETESVYCAVRTGSLNQTDTVSYLTRKSGYVWVGVQRMRTKILENLTTPWNRMRELKRHNIHLLWWWWRLLDPVTRNLINCGVHWCLQKDVQGRWVHRTCLDWIFFYNWPATSSVWVSNIPPMAPAGFRIRLLKTTSTPTNHLIESLELLLQFYWHYSPSKLNVLATLTCSLLLATHERSEPCSSLWSTNLHQLKTSCFFFLYASISSHPYI